jgi:HlyD family secretion protein
MELFRKASLERLRSPEQLDEPLRVIVRQERLAVMGVGGLIILGILWGFLGSLPDNGRGQGILIAPGAIQPLEATASGRLSRWLVNVGDIVSAGAVVAELDQPDISRKLSDAQAGQQELIERNRLIRQLREQHLKLALNVTSSEKQLTRDSIRYLRSYVSEAEVFLDEMTSQNQILQNAQRQKLAKARVVRQELNEALLKRYENFVQLKNKGLVSENNVQNARRYVDQGEIKLRRIDVRLQELEVQSTKTTKGSLTARNALSTRQHELTQLQLKIDELDNRVAILRRALLDATLEDENALRQIERNISSFAAQLKQGREIRMQRGGKVLELNIATGSQVDIGEHIAQLDYSVGPDSLVVLGYFNNTYGRRLKPGMRIRVSPDPYPKERYGSMVGNIVSVAQFPVSLAAVRKSIGNRQLATELIAGGRVIEAQIRLLKSESSQSGYQWTSENGPNAKILPGTTAALLVTYRRQRPFARFAAKYRLSVDRPTLGSG